MPSRYSSPRRGVVAATGARRRARRRSTSRGRAGPAPSGRTGSWARRGGPPGTRPSAGARAASGRWPGRVWGGVVGGYRSCRARGSTSGLGNSLSLLGGGAEALWPAASALIISFAGGPPARPIADPDGWPKPWPARTWPARTWPGRPAWPTQPGRRADEDGTYPAFSQGILAP